MYSADDKHVSLKPDTQALCARNSVACRSCFMIRRLDTSWEHNGEGIYEKLYMTSEPLLVMVLQLRNLGFTSEV